MWELLSYISHNATVAELDRPLNWAEPVGLSSARSVGWSDGLAYWAGFVSPEVWDK